MQITHENVVLKTNHYSEIKIVGNFESNQVSS